MGESGGLRPGLYPADPLRTAGERGTEGGQGEEGSLYGWTAARLLQDCRLLGLGGPSE